MKRTFMISVLLAALPLSAQYSTLMEKGDGADLRGKTRQAANRFEAAAKAAATPEERVVALLKFIDAIRGTRSNSALPDDEAAEVETAFKQALVDATGAASVKAHNDFGVYQLDRGNAASALVTLTQGEKDLESVTPPTRARYLCNLALARTANYQPDEALATYRRALESDPALTGAVEASFSIIKSFDPARGSREAVGLVELLLDKKSYPQAAKLFQAAIDMQAWHDQTLEIQRLLTCFARWAIRSVTPFEKLSEDWLEHFRRLAGSLPGDAGAKSAELTHVFDGTEFSSDFSEDQATKYFAHWTDPDERHDLSSLVMSAAEAALNANKPKQAATRYFVAWQLDGRNLGALTTLAELLNNWKDPDDPTLVDRFTNALYNQNVDAIGNGDAAALLRLNLALGGIFESRGKWGPAEAPRTATFHYIQALDAYEHLRSAATNQPVYPGLRAHLANAYQHLGEKREAWQQYVAAAEENLQIGNMTAADVMIEKATTLGYEDSEADDLRIDAVRKRVASSKASQPSQSADPQIAEVVKQRLSAHPELDVMRIQVEVNQGIVTMRAKFTKELESQAEGLAKSAEGVKEIRINPPEP